MKPMQQLRLYTALKKFTGFKHEKLLNEIRKATIGRQISSKSESGTKGTIDGQVEWNTTDSGFYSEFDSELEDYDFDYSGRGRRGEEHMDFEVDEEEFRRYQEEFQARKNQ